MNNVSDFYSSEAEQLLIGTILCDGTRIDDVPDITVDHFFVRIHKMIFNAMQLELERGEVPEIMTLADYLQKKYPNEMESWVSYLATLAKNTIVPRDLSRCVEVIKDYYQLRKIIKTNIAIDHAARNADKDISDRINESLDIVNELFNVDEASEPKLIQSYARDFVASIEVKFKNESNVTGLTTGYSSVDKRLGGLNPGNLIIIAARPAMGKTNFGLNICRHVGFDLDKPVLLFSLEMTSDEILERLVSQIGIIDYERIRCANIKEDEWPRFSSTVGSFRDAKLIIDESADLTISTLTARARQIKRKHDLGLIVVDHMGLLDAKAENETQKISKISRQLKVLAKQLNVPVIALSQLNRECERRNDKRPILSDLRQSGSIEQDANAVGFLFCEGVYDDDCENPNLVELIWAKLRAGKIGTDYFEKEFHLCRFTETDQPNFSERKKPIPFAKRGMPNATR